ncbi:MAG TPA: galactokinase family protein [Blastocatellia bacterium]|nr:galactokinase family protein [Blastocatellia bacterium]
MNDSESRQQRINSLRTRFSELYEAAPMTVLRAPARINVLGEHVDYVSYLPTASLVFGSGEHEMLMAFRVSDDERVRGASLNSEFAPFAFTLNDAPEPDADWNEWLYDRPVPAPHWGNYVKGAVFFARHLYGRRASRGFDFVVDSTIPPKGGASSSSALTVLAGAAIRMAGEIEFEPHQLARESARAEWYVGTRGGAMDHTAICLSARHHAVYLSYREDTAELVPLPGDDFRWMTFFSHEADKGREMMLEYNERAAVARLLIPSFTGQLSAADDLQAVIENLPVSVALDDIERTNPQVFSACAAAFPALVQERRTRPLKLRDRAQHHLGEMRRVEAAARLLRQASDRDSPEVMRELGRLLNESHASLRDLYEVSTPQVNHLIEIITADPEVYGARLMGGGFGGNVLALTTATNVQALVSRVQRDFYSPQQRDARREGAVMISTPGDGLSAVQ